MTADRGPDAPYEIFEIPDFTLVSGQTLRPARIAYRTYGTLNADKSNAIVYPTWYSGRHWDNEWLIGDGGDGMALDPSKWFIIVPNMLGNGLSSSPSNTPPCRFASSPRLRSSAIPSTKRLPNAVSFRSAPFSACARVPPRPRMRSICAASRVRRS